MTNRPQLATDLERELFEALQVTAGILRALDVDDDLGFKFNGRFAHLGTATVGQALDRADRALGVARQADKTET